MRDIHIIEAVLNPDESYGTVNHLEHGVRAGNIHLRFLRYLSPALDFQQHVCSPLLACTAGAPLLHGKHQCACCLRPFAVQAARLQALPWLLRAGATASDDQAAGLQALRTSYCSRAARAALGLGSLLRCSCAQLQANSISNSRPCAWLGRTNDPLWTVGMNMLHAKSKALLAAGKSQIAQRCTYVFWPNREPLMWENFSPATGS